MNWYEIESSVFYIWFWKFQTWQEGKKILISSYVRPKDYINYYDSSVGQIYVDDSASLDRLSEHDSGVNRRSPIRISELQLHQNPKVSEKLGHETKRNCFTHVRRDDACCQNLTGRIWMHRPMLFCPCHDLIKLIWVLKEKGRGWEIRMNFRIASYPYARCHESSYQLQSHAMKRHC